MQRLVPPELRGYTPQELSQPASPLAFNARTGHQYTVGEMEAAKSGPLWAPVSGAQTIGAGVEQMAQPDSAEKLRGAGKVLTGAVDVASPAFVAAGATAPLEAAAWYAISKAAQKTGQAAATIAGANPEDAQEIGDVASAVPLVYGFGKIAVRVEQSEPGTASEVLCDQVQQQRRFAGAGLANNVEMPPPLFRGEHDQIARDAGTEKKLL